MVFRSFLLWFVLVPTIGAVVSLLLPSRLAKKAALLTSLIGVGLAALAYHWFDPYSQLPYQFYWAIPWISSLHVQFALGMDGLSFPLVLLTKLMVPIAILASWKETRHVSAFMASYLLLDTAMTGTFLATDVILFYVFWEILLIPMMVLIGIWGGADRVYATIKFFLFTLTGSLFMLVAIFYVLLVHYQQQGAYSADIHSLYQLALSASPVLFGLNVQDLLFLGFFIAFAIKVPLFPLHTWLPDAHVQAPTGGSILLAAVLLKMGTYGLLRFAIPICPSAFLKFAPWVAALSLVSILYGAWVAYQQRDMKKLVAYSSVSHLGFVVLGICTLTQAGIVGAVLQMVNHGLSTGALFFLVGALYDRRHSRQFDDLGGLANILPGYAVALTFVACSSMGVPGLNGFIGEFLILFGAFEAHPLWASIAVLGVIFGAAYTLLMLREVLFGQPKTIENRSLKDLNWIEWSGLAPLFIAILLLGLSPSFLTAKFEPSITRYLLTVGGLSR